MSYDSQTFIANRRDFDTSYTNEFDQNQTAAALITPTSGKLLQIVGVYVATEATSGTLRLYMGTSSNTIVQMYASSGDTKAGYIPLSIVGTRNEVLRITSTLGADNNYWILVNYKER